MFSSGAAGDGQSGAAPDQQPGQRPNADRVFGDVFEDVRLPFFPLSLTHTFFNTLSNRGRCPPLFFFFFSC